MAKAFLTFSNLSSDNKILVDWAEIMAPLAILGTSQAFDPPHDAQTLTVDGLRPFVHRFQFWESEDGSSKDTLLLSMDVDCSQNASEIIIYDYKVGRGTVSNDPEWADPVHGGTTVFDERLKGAYAFFIEQRGIGKLLPEEVTKTIDADGVYTGQWALNDIQFSQGDVFFAIVERRATVSYSFSSGSGGGGWDVVEQFADVAIGSSYFGKMIECDFNTVQGLITIPALGLIPAGTRLRISNASTSSINRYVKVAMDSGTFRFRGKARGGLWLGRGDMIEFLFTGTKCFVTDYEGSYGGVGKIFWGYAEEVHLNALPLLVSDAYDINTLERLYWDYVAYLPVNRLVDFGTYDAFTNRIIDGIVKWDFYGKGFFGINLTTSPGQMKLPDLSGRFLQALDEANDERNENWAGGLGMDMVGEFPLHIEFGRTKRGTGGDPSHALMAPGGDPFGTNPVNFDAIANLGRHTKPKNINLIPLIGI